MPTLLASVAKTYSASYPILEINKIGAKIIRDLSVSKEAFVFSEWTPFPGVFLRHVSVSGAAQSEKW
jgi:hypothetical protein